jgi:hypothetical protein
MSGLLSNSLFLSTAAGGGAGYQIERSLRFNSSDSAYLSRTPASSSNRKTWTWAGWVKRSSISAAFENMIFSASGYSGIRIEGDNTLLIFDYAGSFNYKLATTQVFRDSSAWYHLVFALDTTQATASNRLKLYVNGIEVTQFSATTYPSLNYDGFVNAATAHNIGRNPDAPTQKFDGLLADIHFIDGQALDPSSFGEFDTNGVWQPIDASGLTFGTNGFHLPFSDNSTAAALGTDTSSNGNTWTVNNLSVTNGNGDYVSGLSGTFASGYEGINMFDGSLITFAASSGFNSSFTWTYTLNSVSTLRIYAQKAGSPPDITVNSTSRTLAGGTGWTSIDLTGIGSTITSIIFPRGGSGVYQDIAAIEVNGIVLVDNSFSSGNDSLVDSPTNGSQVDTGAGGEVVGNYCTLNPLSSSNGTLSNGNLTHSGGSGNGRERPSTFAASSGKWYFEGTLTSWTDSGSDAAVGVTDITKIDLTKEPGQYATSYIIYNYTAFANIQKLNNGSSTATDTTRAVQGDIIGIAFDLDNNRFYAHKNGTWIDGLSPGGTALFNLTSGTYTPVSQISYANSMTWDYNFGQRQWAYAAPAGFKALCTTNLPEPTIADGSQYFQVITYPGNGTTQTLPNINSEPSSGLNFSPDLVWIKGRSAVTNHRLLDTIRGATKELYSSTTDAETTQAQSLTAFNSDGFSLGSLAAVNESSQTFVAWTWDAGSSTVTNTEGSISSQVRANASAGFSIVTFTGAGSTATIGHGLGVEPHWIIVKNRTGSADNWSVYTKTSGAGNQIYLNLTDAVGGGSVFPSAPTSTLMTIGGGYVGSTIQSVAYCFAPVAGYSSFGSYTGNGSTDGPFVYTGFRPRWVLFKKSSAAGDPWLIYDSVRDTFNVAEWRLAPNNSGADSQSTVYSINLLSNGFKINTDDTSWNASGATFIYAAFAESPFAYARAR